MELTRPWEVLKVAGALPCLISLKPGEIRGTKNTERGDTFTVDKTVTEVRASDYDALVIPSGVDSIDALRTNRDAVRLVRQFMELNYPVAAIGRGPSLLIEAGAVKGRTVAAWPSLKTDIENAGGTWVDEEVHVDQGLVTSRKPDDIPAFCAKTIEEVAEGVHERQAAAGARA